MAKVTVLGSGGWGMALGLAAHENGCQVALWSPFKEEVALLTEKRTNERLLKDIYLPESITITDDLSVVAGDDITIIATPSIAIAEVAEKLSAYKNKGIVVNVAKGLCKGSLKRLSEVITEKLPECDIVVLSGPSHAEEVARRVPTSLVAASKNVQAALEVQQIMSSEVLRIYTSADVIGVELGGAIKNVIAIAAGACDGLSLGDNTKAALITRGLAEMARLGIALGADEYTFAGLAGVGDLIVTCMSRHSRNNRFGFKIGSGVPIKQALKEVGTVEGYYAADMTNSLAAKYDVEMPIVNECYKIMYEEKDVKRALLDLLNRPNKSER